jgi:hypothetical protein
MAFMEDKNNSQRPLLSVEAAASVVVGLIVGLTQMDWWLRGLGVLATAILAIHTGKRMDGAKRFAFPVLAIGILIAGTWNPIWTGFHEDFPTITAEITLSKIIEASILMGCLVSAYFFLLRPREKEGYRVLPAQLIAFGACVMAFGLVAILVGLVWQFQQNWAAGIKPSGSPVFSLVTPQIAPTIPPRALPAPLQALQGPYFSDYNLTEAGVTALGDELYKIRDALGKRIELDRMATDPTPSGFISNFIRACDPAGIECPVSDVHPNSPDEKGILFYVADPKEPPAAAKELYAALLKLGIDVPFVARPGFGGTTFSLFVGPRPPRN